MISFEINFNNQYKSKLLLIYHKNNANISVNDILYEKYIRTLPYKNIYL